MILLTYVQGDPSPYRAMDEHGRRTGVQARRLSFWRQQLRWLHTLWRREAGRVLRSPKGVAG